MSVYPECLSSQGDEIEHLLEAVIYPLAIDILYLINREVGGGMGKLVVAVVVARLEDVLHNILEIAVPSCRHCLAAKFVKRLPRTVDILPYTPVASVLLIEPYAQKHVEKNMKLKY